MCFRTAFFYEVNGKRTEGKPGDCIVHRPGTKVSHGPINDNESFVNDWIYFSAEDFEINSFPFDVILPTGDENFYLSEIMSIIKENERRDDFSEQIISNSIQKMLVLSYRTASRGESYESEEQKRFSQIRKHILERYGEEWTLEKMAEYSGYSVSRFCALYSGFFAKSPINDLLEKRVKEAKRFLELDLHKIEDIAVGCGFSSIHYFSRFFKKCVGVSPTEYRRFFKSVK
jgi:AraC-like DNA-binding protein